MGYETELECPSQGGKQSVANRLLSLLFTKSLTCPQGRSELRWHVARAILVG
jgi:hypothetical protein